MPQICDMGPTALLPLRRKAHWGFFRPKNPTASAGVPQQLLGRNFPSHCFHIVKNILLSDYFIFLIYCVLLMRDWICMNEWNDTNFHHIWTSFSMNTKQYVLLKQSAFYYLVSEKFTSLNSTGESHFRWPKYTLELIPAAGRSKAQVYGSPLAEIVGSNPFLRMDVCCECCVLSGKGVCGELITRPEESYRACVCVSLSIIRYNNHHLLLEWVS